MVEEFNVKVVGIVFDTLSRKILLLKDKSAEKFSFIEGDLSFSEELDKRLKSVVKEVTCYDVHNLGAIYAENMLDDPKILKLYFLCEAVEGCNIKDSFDFVWINPAEVESKLGFSLPTRLSEYLLGLE